MTISIKNRTQWDLEAWVNMTELIDSEGADTSWPSIDRPVSSTWWTESIVRMLPFNSRFDDLSVCFVLWTERKKRGKERSRENTAIKLKIGVFLNGWKLKIQHLLSTQCRTNHTILSAWRGPVVDRVNRKRHKEPEMFKLKVVNRAGFLKFSM